MKEHLVTTNNILYNELVHRLPNYGHLDNKENINIIKKFIGQIKNSNYNLMLGMRVCKEEKTFLMSEEGKQED